jgi:hypothetical protein
MKPVAEQCEHGEVVRSVLCGPARSCARFEFLIIFFDFRVSAKILFLLHG